MKIIFRDFPENNVPCFSPSLGTAIYLFFFVQKVLYTAGEKNSEIRDSLLLELPSAFYAYRKKLEFFIALAL